MSLAVGDVVRLKTGGPEMTLESTDSTLEKANCVWFEKSGSHYGGQLGAMVNGGVSSWLGPLRAQFSLAALEKVSQ